ncbi:TadE/TadG family type IV pilus assembly protein [Mesorhizobium sp. dw_380]|uniref:TadE/TadG family type IV pilus assembly protein n=1 Tax=Mesorhizobium sp. dw_380 TaxID=2812001 RepID=UPI001BDE1AF9|nr:TadE/TadG family type IV pilus assembly protein [Mesorhizobium sp. dw_380]
MMRAGAHPGIAGIWSKAAGFWSNRRGVAAVEFALIVPILLVMYFVTMEASQAIETSKKVSRIGSMVADLVTQQPTIVKADLDAIMKIGTSTIQPYNRSTPNITITAIQVTTDTPPKVQVVWSRKVVNGVYSIGTTLPATTTVPATLKVAGTFLIRTESNLAYQPMITWSADSQQKLGMPSAFASTISMGETYYLRPRRSLTIPCSDC